MRPLTSHTLPPGLNQPAQGTLKIIINSIFFSSKTIPSAINYSTKFWGQNQQQSAFFQSAENGMIVEYKVCCSKDAFSKYLFDMQTLIIFLHDARNVKNIGIIPVPLRRFSTLNQHGSPKIDDIKERFGIYDLKKQKVGEASIEILIAFNILTTDSTFKYAPIGMGRISEIDSSPSNRTQNQIVNAMRENDYLNPKQHQNNFYERQHSVQKNQMPYPSLPPLAPKKNKPQFILPVAQKLNIPIINLQLQALKLKNDEYLFKKEQIKLNSEEQKICQTQYIIQIINVKLKTKITKPIDKLTLIYPQHSNSNHLTTIINPTKVQNNTYSFGQQLTIRLKNNQNNSLSDISLEAYFGQGHIDTSFDKLRLDNHEETLILRKKDNTKHSQMSIKVRKQSKTEQFKVYIYLGKYTIYHQNNSFLRLNFGSELESKTIILTNQKKIDFETTITTSKKSLLCFIEIWSKQGNKEIIKGSIQLNIERGNMYNKIPLLTIMKENIGWLEVYWCMENQQQTNANVQSFKQKLKQNQSNQSKQNTFQYQQISRKQISKQKRIGKNDPNQVVNKRDQQKPYQLSSQFNLIEPNLSYSDLYTRLLNNWHINIDASNKIISDHLASLQYVTRAQLHSWFQKLLTPSQSQKLLQIFSDSFKFKYLIDSYYSYCQYLQMYRKTLSKLASYLSSTFTDVTILLEQLSATIAYFGYVQVDQLRGIFERLIIQPSLVQNLLFFLANDDKKMIFKKTIIDFIKSKKVEGIIPNARILAHLMRLSGLGENNQWVIEDMTHFEHIVLKDNQPQQIPDVQFNADESEISNIQNQNYVIKARTQSKNSKNISHQQNHKADDVSNYSSQQQGVVKQFRKHVMKKQLTQIRIQSIQSQIPSLTDIIINGKIYISISQLPKVVRVYNQEQLNMRVHSEQGIILEGCIVVDEWMKNKSMGLFVKNKEVGRVLFGSQQTDVIVNLQKTKQIKNTQLSSDPMTKQKQEEQSNETSFIFANIPLDIEILEITPNAKCLISIQKSQTKQLNFPQQYLTTVISDSGKLRLNVSLQGQHTSQCTIYLKQGLQKYPLLKADGSVLCIVQIKIKESTTNILNENRKQRLFLIVKDLYKFAQITSAPLVYVLIQYNNTFKRTQQFSMKKFRQTIDFSIQIEEADIYSIKVFGRKDKLLCKFQFQIKCTPRNGVKALNRVLSSQQYRLSLTLFQVGIQKDLEIRQDKIENIMRIFSMSIIKNIDKQLAKNRQLKQILKNDFSYTLSEINIIQNMLQDYDCKQFFSLFSEKQKIISHHSIKNVFDEFSVFDFDQSGYVTKQNAIKICHLLEIDLNLQQFIPSNQHNIIDVSNKYKDQLDYYHLIIKLFPNQYLFKNQKDQVASIENQQIKGYSRIQLLGFSDLQYLERPPNICIEINGQFISDPILRCSTHQFQECPQTFVEMPTSVKIYNKQYGGNSLWSYKLIAECPLSEIIGVLGGMVKFKITKLNQLDIQSIASTFIKNKRLEKQQKEKPVVENFTELKNISSIEQSSKNNIPIENPFKTIHQQMRQTKKKQIDLTQQQIEQAKKINTILMGDFNISKYKFQSSDEQS